MLPDETLNRLLDKRNLLNFFIGEKITSVAGTNRRYHFLKQNDLGCIRSVLRKCRELRDEEDHVSTFKDRTGFKEEKFNYLNEESFLSALKNIGYFKEISNGCEFYTKEYGEKEA